MTLREWCRANWNSLPELIRKDCLDHLEDWFDPQTKAKDIEWLRNYDSEPYFHFSMGMAIRNRLRGQLTDMELPLITTDHEGKPYGPSQNWDDYYTGALDEFLERHTE
jgi:hypothetical protein